MSKRNKLTEEQVRAIHKSPLSCAKLATKYGVSRQAIWQIKTGLSHPSLRLGLTKKFRDIKMARFLKETPHATSNTSSIVEERHDEPPTVAR